MLDRLPSDYNMATDSPMLPNGSLSPEHQMAITSSTDEKHHSDAEHAITTDPVDLGLSQAESTANATAGRSDETILSPQQSAHDVSSPRPESPSPSVTPSLALDAVPALDLRSVSTPSSSEGSTLSRKRSRYSFRSDGGGTVVHRRGYMRPQGTSFAESARSRDSVMSLGSIAHMQYYFARTGLLDGKGGQLAKEKKRSSSATVTTASTKSHESMEPSSFLMYDFSSTAPSMADGASNYAVSDSGIDSGMLESPSEMTHNGEPWASSPDSIMLPPTVSTYKVKPEFIEPPPDLPVLRRELKEALQDACKVLEESQKPALIDGEPPAENSGFYEVQGLHLLDIITLAIRAAKNYYTAHPNPRKLYTLRSEKVIRSDLYQVLDTLKRMASRNFRGGVRLLELTDIVTWIESIDKLLKKEEAQEQAEAAERESWVWREGDWTGREREREWLFLKSFDAMEPALPQWPEASPTSTDASLPNAFLLALQDGQRLVRLHNTLVGRSNRRFGEIKTYHTDTAKPYRMTENLIYWVKAAELRWDVLITVPIADVVHSKDEAAWRAFDEAILTWSRGVRTELMEEWNREAKTLERRRPPEVKVEGVDGDGAPSASEESATETAPSAVESKAESTVDFAGVHEKEEVKKQTEVAETPSLAVEATSPV
jgi:hypothetical protein